MDPCGPTRATRSEGISLQRALCPQGERQLLMARRSRPGEVPEATSLRHTFMACAGRWNNGVVIRRMRLDGRGPGMGQGKRI